ncbi:M13 family metallopeptidase [Pseudoduganella aquatica]|uniref:M13 family peptidase n=1 Tax=Pseudoduganella aquatica TaxID=2660641 RepID=A0A7X4H711_9BURK|nr:M13 family metallopeptidase [Pseudoduganella aquatica]MYN05886.1 M13 family peptidase [Pseudoduganella aquatica]
MRTRLSQLALAALSLAAAAPATAVGLPEYGTFGLDLDARSTAVKPGNDFWSYANGGWAQRTQIGPTMDAAGVTVLMHENASSNVRRIVEDMARQPAYGTAGQQIGKLYLSWMNEAAIEARGPAALRPYLARIQSASSHAAVQALFAEAGYASPLAIEPDVHPADPRRYILNIAQGELGLPRDYYLKEGGEYARVRSAYRAYVRQVQELAGMDGAEAKADAIIALETALAKVHWTMAESREQSKTSNIETRASLEAKYAEFDWTRLLASYALPPAAEVLVMQESAVKEIGRIVAATPVQDWKDYLAYRFISDHAESLPASFANARFELYGRTLAGLQSRPERWKRGVQLVNSIFGEEVGRIYVERHYPQAASRQMRELVEDVRAAYRDRISASSWMDSATRQKALAKLSALKALIGGPDSYPGRAAGAIEKDDLLGNLVRADAAARKRGAERLHKPVDPAEWLVTPQTMNAYYDYHSNAIVFPAAMLQAPFFDPRADAAVNYGTIGALIGHEMGHGFDDQGRQYGADGTRENWWTEASAQSFQRRADALAAQYDHYQPLPGAQVNGKLTLGENIADLSGVEAAYAAYQSYQKRHGKAKVLAGLSGEQRFFMAFAQGRRAKVNEAAMRQLLVIDTHAPSLFRVNGTLRNVDAWYRAFNVQRGDAFYLAPAERVHIW